MAAARGESPLELLGELISGPCELREVDGPTRRPPVAVASEPAAKRFDELERELPAGIGGEAIAAIGVLPLRDLPRALKQLGEEVLSLRPLEMDPRAAKLPVEDGGGEGLDIVDLRFGVSGLPLSRSGARTAARTGLPPQGASRFSSRER